MKVIFRSAVVLLLLVVAVPAGARDLLSEERFTEAFARVLQDQAPDLTVQRTGPLHLTGRDAAGKEFQALLDNAYKTYRQDPEALDEIVNIYTAGLIETWRADDVIDPTRIVPVIKDAAYIPEIGAAMASRGADAGWQPAHDVYNSELVILYAEDTERSIRYMTEEELAKSGFAADGRRARAVANLKAQLPGVQAQGADGIYRLMAGGDYDVSLLLFDKFWESGQLRVKGEIVVAIPARNVLFVTGSEDPKGLTALRNVIAEAFSTESYTLTDRLFVYRNGKFVPFES